MIPFNLHDFIANPSRKVITRNGRSVLIGRIDMNGSYPIKAVIDNELFLTFDRDGHLPEVKDGSLDLFFATEVKEKWVNVYRDWENGYELGSIIFDSEEYAKDGNEGHPTYVATAKITWEEPLDTK